jgi:hypothetical protein
MSWESLYFSCLILKVWVWFVKPMGKTDVLRHLRAYSYNYVMLGLGPLYF